MSETRKTGQIKFLTEKFSSLMAQREFSLFVVLVMACILMSSLSPVFFTRANAEAMLLALSVDALIAVGMVVLLISGGLDLSIGSTLGLTGVVTGLLLNSGIPTWIAIIGGLVSAILVGIGNGLLVARMKINPFITTLGMQMMIRGLLLVLAGGKAVLNLPESFTVIGQGRLLGIQFPIYVMLFIVIVGEILVRNTRFFRQSYYIGGNEKSARLSGINVDLIKIFNYSLVAALAGVAGLLITARFGSSSVTVGGGLELRVITATIIGGASLNGGEGSVIGAFMGAAFMAILANSLNLLGVDVYWQNLVTGLILIVAVVIDVLNEKRKAGQK